MRGGLTLTVVQNHVRLVDTWSQQTDTFGVFMNQSAFSKLREGGTRIIRSVVMNLCRLKQLVSFDPTTKA